LIQRFAFVVLGLSLFLSGGCVRPRPATVPLRTIAPPAAGGGDARCLVVLLPGRRDRPEDFVRHEFAEIAARAGVRADFVAVDAHLGYYYRKTIVDRLREDVIAPARKRYDRIWLTGISLGGTGSLLYTIESPDDVDGIVLLAPFLGEEPVIDEIAAAGGPRGWTAPDSLSPDDFQRRMWSWLERYENGSQGQIPIFLGFGTQDDFARANGLLGGVLPPDRVFTVDGGHTWQAWQALWEKAVATGAICM
jgi:pimeloyl-ACP methyl ester carboxylesterase